MDTLPCTPPRCTDLAHHVPDFCCESCGRGHLWQQLDLDRDRFRLLCESCYEKALTEVRRRRCIAVLRQPVFYVVMSVGIAGILFAAGVGRVSVDDLRERDSGKPPHLQKLGNLYVERGARIRARLRLLEHYGPAADVRKWAVPALKSYHLANAYWQDDSVSAELLACIAVLLAKAGAVDEAYDHLRALDGRLSSRSRRTYLYYRGGLALQLGRVQSCLNDWEIVLQEAAGSAVPSLDTLIDLNEERSASYILEPTPEMWRDNVAELSGMRLREGVIYARILQEVEHAGLDSAVARDLKRYMNVMSQPATRARDASRPLVEPIDDP